MPSAPFDVSHPSVALYLALVRLQVLTPLSVLINISTCLLCTFLVHPTIPQVSKTYPTSITPSPLGVGIYWLVVYAGQIAFCLLLVLARKEETKRTLVSMGMSVILANWVMAAWAITWIREAFIASTVLLGLLVVLLTYANLNLLLRTDNAPTMSRPLDTAIIHTPIRLFLIMPLNLMFSESLFIALKHTWSDKRVEKHSYHWEGMAAILSANALGLLIVLLRRDIVWCVAAMWVLVCIAFGPHTNMPVLVSSIVFLVLYPVGLGAVLLWRARRESEGAIALPPDSDAPLGPDDEVERLRIHITDDEAHANGREAIPPPKVDNEPPRESVEEAVWGS